jgi:phenylpyruvate tautomerase PptA (4-oxalocrotonate tautomerase family)
MQQLHCILEHWSPLMAASLKQPTSKSFDMLSALETKLTQPFHWGLVMPYLQLDVNGHYSLEDKERLVRALCETYSDMMSVDIRRISIAIRELGEGAVWRTIDGKPTPVSVLMCDIRRGRSAELRLEVAKALCKICVEVLGLREDRLNVEFTQHAGDEMYHPTLGGYSPEWSADET